MIASMTDYPKPEGYGKGSSDGTILTNTKGRLAINEDSETGLLTNERLNEGNGGDPDCH